MSYWKSQNLKSKIFKICPQASLGHSAGNSSFRSPVKCRMRTFRTGLYMQGADTQGPRRLTISTVRKSLKVKRNFQKSSKIQLSFVTQKVLQGILKTQKFTNQEKKATRANGHRNFKKPKKTKVFIPSGVANFVYG